MLTLALLLSLAHAAPKAGPAPTAAPAEALEKQYPLRDLDLHLRVPLEPQKRGPALATWEPPPWAQSSPISLALEKRGSQILAMAEEVPMAFQPSFHPDAAATAGPWLAARFLESTYTGPKLGTVQWQGFQVVEGGPLGKRLRGTASVELPDRTDTSGTLVLDFIARRGGLVAMLTLGVEDPALVAAALDELEGYAAYYDGPVAEADLPTGRQVERAGYSFDLPAGFRALTERERLALNGEPVGGNSGYGGALAHQTWLDPTDPTGARSFGCVAWSGATLEVVPPGRAPRLAENYRKMASLVLRNGAYTVDGGKPIRGRSADLLSGRLIQVDPKVEGELRTLPVNDRLAYHWVTTGTQSARAGGSRTVSVHTFYTAWSDVNLHCQASAEQAGDTLLAAFDQAMGSLRIDEADKHPMKLSLMSQYRIWWPHENPLFQLYWLPVPIILFAAWLASRGD